MLTHEIRRSRFLRAQFLVFFLSFLFFFSCISLSPSPRRTAVRITFPIPLNSWSFSNYRLNHSNRAFAFSSTPSELVSMLIRHHLPSLMYLIRTRYYSRVYRPDRYWFSRSMSFSLFIREIFFFQLRKLWKQVFFRED